MIMQDDEQLLEHRFADLARRASERRIAVYSEFLDLAQQETLERMKGLSLDSGWGMWGGFEGAERRIARFGGGERDGYPLVYLTVSPRAAKFADELTHRDFLGALMSLGMRREVLGDILVDESCATVVCLASAAEYMAENLERIKRTSVVCALSSQSPKTLSPAMRE
ncbi:MAG: YlmH/Sll1252 family protein, partial [Oscillospiraceae bacterium]